MGFMCALGTWSAPGRLLPRSGSCPSGLVVHLCSTSDSRSRSVTFLLTRLCPSLWWSPYVALPRRALAALPPGAAPGGSWTWPPHNPKDRASWSHPCPPAGLLWGRAGLWLSGSLLQDSAQLLEALVTWCSVASLTAALVLVTLPAASVFTGASHVCLQSSHF